MSTAMTSEVEREFLESLLDVQNAITNKANIKEAKQRRANAWKAVQEDVLKKTAKDIPVSKLLKKWNNIQSRLKDKLRNAKGTGGGPPSSLNGNDELARRILGENNPKLVRVPGGMENCVPFTKTDESHEESTRDTPSLGSVESDSENELENIEPNQTPRSSKMITRPKNKTTKFGTVKTLNELHREVLLLEREKLLLEIKKLKKETANKACQVDSLDLVMIAGSYN